MAFWFGLGSGALAAGLDNGRFSVSAHSLRLLVFPRLPFQWAKRRPLNSLFLIGNLAAQFTNVIDVARGV